MARFDGHDNCQSNYSFAAVKVQFDSQNYTVTEGEVVYITLVTSPSNYSFGFNVTLQHMNGSATGESCSVTCIVSHFIGVSIPKYTVDPLMVIVHP